MFGRIIALVLALSLGVSALPQKPVTVVGFLRDSLSHDPIVSAHILTPDEGTVTSDSKGFFRIRVDSIPAELRISHVTYGIHRVPIDRYTTGDTLVIYLQPSIKEIEPVAITSKRLVVLTRQKNFSITDFSFDKENMWLIISESNNPFKLRLCLADAYGDTLKSMSVRAPAKLYRDIFENVHLELEDTIYQLFSPDRNTIRLLYGENPEKFHLIVDRYKASFGENLVFINHNRQFEMARVFYNRSDASSNFLLTEVQDSLERVRKMLDRNAGSMWIDLKSSKYWKANTRIAEIYEGEVPVPLFTWNATLYIVNVFKDSLLGYSNEGNWIGAVPFSLKDNRLVWDRKVDNVRFLVDDSENRCYLLANMDPGWKLFSFDPKTGSMDAEIPLPDYPGMTHISVFKNAVYFLYPERIHPFYVRMYRYQL